MATRQNLLSPEELSALSEGLKDGSLESDTGFNTGVRVRKHDLASENSSLGVNVSSIDMINERFIRMFRLGLLEVLRTTPRVNPTRVQIMKFGHYLGMLKAPLSVNTIRINPMRGNSVIIIDPNVVFSSLDSFFWRLRQGRVRFTARPFVHRHRNTHHPHHFGSFFPLAQGSLGSCAGD